MICLGVESTAHTFGASMVDDDDRVITNVNSTYRPPAGVGIHPRKASEHHAAVSDSIIGKAIRSSEGGQFDPDAIARSEEHTSELQSHSDLVCRLLLEKKKQ